MRSENACGKDVKQQIFCPKTATSSPGRFPWTGKSGLGERGLGGRKTFSSPGPRVPLAGEVKGTGGSGHENEKKGVPTFFSPGPGHARFASLADFLFRPALLVSLFTGYKTDKTKAVGGINSVSRLG